MTIKKAVIISAVFLIIALSSISLIRYKKIAKEDSKNKEHVQMLNLKIGFKEKLFFPPNLDASEIKKDGTKVFNLEPKEEEHAFSEEYQGKTLAYNGLPYLGPSLIVSKGDRLQINVKNSLNQTTSVHWHGLYANEEDDGVMTPIKAGQTWQANFTVNQDSQSTFYHPHPMDIVASQVYYGLAGLFIIKDDPKGHSLPKTLGLDDVPLVVQDRLFIDGKLKLVDNVVFGPKTNATIVNGSINPYFDVKTKRLRLRIYNADNAKTYKFSISDPKVKMAAIAGDGGLLPKPFETNEISLGTGERYEVILDFSNASQKEVFLNSVISRSAVKNESTKTMHRMMHDMHKNQSQEKNLQTVPIVLFKISENLLENEEIPKSLKKERNPILKQYFNKSPQKNFVFVHMQHMAPNLKNENNQYVLSLDGAMEQKPEFTLKRNSQEVWQIENRDRHGNMAMDAAMIHSFHVHGLQFYVLSVNGKEPPLDLQGLKDTVNLKSGDVFKILVLTKNNTGTFVYHCHVLEHEEGGMMRYFQAL